MLEAAPAAPEPQDPNKSYWAALENLEEYADACFERIREYYEGRLDALPLWKAAHHAFYSLSENGQHEASKAIEFGTDGEMLGVRSNQARSIIRYIHTSATADRPAWLPRATSASAAAMSQVSTARQLLDYYFYKKGLERALNSTALRSLLYGQGYLLELWDVSAGPRDPATGKPVGDVFVCSLSPDSVVSDLERAPGEHDWFIIRRWRNRYDVAAQYAPVEMPDLAELREEIIGIDSEGPEADYSMKSQIAASKKRGESGDISVWYVLHRPTPACPEGRMSILTGRDIVLFDGPLPYDDLHVYEMTPEEFLEAGNLGYGAIWEVMGLQQVYDGLNSTAVSNFDAMGTNDIMLPDGMEVGHEEVRDGLNIIRYPAGMPPPAVLEKFSLPDAFFKLREGVREDMQLALGVNNVVRGDPEASLKSGSALALVQAQAVHFQSAFNGAYVRLQEQAGTGLIQILKKFAKIERLAAIVGAYEADALKSFKADDINQIDRVDVEVSNPIFKTVAGKFDIATQLLERGLIKDVNQYYQVLETGRLEPVSDPARRAAMRVREENEALMQGPPVEPVIDMATGAQQVDPMTGMPLTRVKDIPVVVTQSPLDHIAGHADVLNSREALSNPAVVLAVTTHIQEHMRVWKAADPELMLLLGFPVAGMQAAAPAAEAKGGDPAKGANDQKSREASEKATGGNAPGAGRPTKLPRPAQPPPEMEV